MINNLYDDQEGAENEDPNIEDTSSDNNEDASMTQAQESSMSKSKESWSKKTTDAVKKAVKNWKGKSSLLAAIGPILLWIFIALVILIIIIGLVMFLVTMPGMVMEQLKALFNSLGNYVAAFFGADTTQQIDDTEIFDTLDYLEQMGYDLKGFGFLTDYVDSLDVGEDYDNSNGAKLDTKTGVIRNDDDKIIYAKSDFIYTYIMSDNYVYTLKNDNLTSAPKNKVAELKGSSWWEKALEALKGAMDKVTITLYKIENFFAGPLFDITGTTNSMGEIYGKGLIALYYEKDDIIGKKGTMVNTDSLWNWDSVKINAKSKKLSIKRNGLFNGNNAIDYSLDGWSGRYGMPIEFLLSMHLASMMPDLSVDMVTNFPTEIDVYLHKISGEATTAFKTSSGYVTYEELENALSNVSGRNFLSAAKAWLDDCIINNSEANAAFALGLPHSKNCTCSAAEPEERYYYDGKRVFLEGGKYFYYKLVVTAMGSTFEEVYLTDDQVAGVVEAGKEEGLNVCSECKKHIKAILKYLRKDNDYSFLAYEPYIANVKNHWYRDVYFVIEDTNLKFVDYDYEYEAMMKERWTLYETDDYGDYVLYEVNQDGSLGNKFNGTEEEAKKQNKIVGKKAVTVDASNSEVMEDLGWGNPDEIWVAYEENKDFSGTEYEPMYPDIPEDEEDYDIKINIYVKMEMLGTVLQTGEGQRTETNNKIKKMFLQNNYFRYDGSTETAEIITELRKKVASNHGISSGAYHTALSDNDMNTSVSLTRNGETKEYKASDYAGKVSLNQDSLNAFSMLENTHTLDADYIYRDFKELIVELGYFTKEELTEETPRLLQWLIPDISSGGFPKRELDKREDEYGTMIHSKLDYEANKKNTLLFKLKDFLNQETESDSELESVSGIGQELQTVSGITDISMRNSLNLANSVGALDGDRDPSEVSVSEFLDAAADVHSRMEGSFWEYCAAGVHSGASSRHTGDGSCPGNYATFVAASSAGKTADCSSYVSWVLQEVGVIKGKYTSEGMYTALAEYILTKEEAGELQAGDIVLTSRTCTNKWRSQYTI